MMLDGCLKRTSILEGITDLGKGLGTQIIKHTKNNNPRVIVGHDYRSYSEDIKKALINGLVVTGCNVEDIGLIPFTHCLLFTVSFKF